MDKKLMETMINPLVTSSHKQKILDKISTVGEYLESWPEDKIPASDWTSIASLLKSAMTDANMAALMLEDFSDTRN